MGKLAEYYKQTGYKPIYFIGDRVFGHFNKIPFIGTVGNDTQINEIEGPRISIHLDLPIKVNNNIRNVITVKHQDIKKLAEF